MKNKVPIYNSYGATQPADLSKKKTKHRFKVADSLNDLMKVIAIRSAVYIAEQECPYDEEFEGNDFCALHIIGYSGVEPVACIRLRFFAEFAKLERLAVRHEFRNTRLSFKIVHAGIELARKKGYQKIYGHAQDRLVNFWTRFNAKPLEKNIKLKFSKFSYTEMLINTEPHPSPLNLDSDPYVLIRTEGAWHEAGVLERSARRNVTSPLRDLRAA